MRSAFRWTEARRSKRRDVEPVERPAPAIVDRDFVNTALNTGLLVIDAMLPLGRGQRELIIGDRETGKTAIAIDTIINQRDSGVICVYCAVGQKTSSVSQVIDAVKRLRRAGAMHFRVRACGRSARNPMAGAICGLHHGRVLLGTRRRRAVDYRRS